MASDLSQLIHEGLCSTINGLLTKTTTLKTITKIHEKDLENLQVLKINSTFEFNDIVSTWSYIIPAYTGSYIFNAMIGDDSEPVLEFDSDIADAMNEVVSNISGGLTTAINGSEFEDLGTSKFTTSSEGIIDASTLIDNENMYKFALDLDGTDLDIFIIFDKLILPFIETIKQSEVTKYEDEVEEKIEEVQNQEEEKTPTNDEKEETKEETKIVEEQQDDTEDDSKNKKLKKLIIVVAGLIVTTIVAGVTMFFLGMFDPEPIVVDQNKTKIVKTEDNIHIIKYNYTPKVNFKLSDINIDRLNKRLKILTKYDILTDKEIAKQKAEEEKRLYFIKKEKELEAFAKLNKEESLHKKENTKEQTSLITVTPEIINNMEKKFLVMDSLKYSGYKELIKKLNSKDARISICQNEIGKTLVYIGPFKDENIQKDMKKLIKNRYNDLEIKLVTLTQEQFNEQCDF